MVMYPNGCIFREDFKSPELAARNGLVNLGTGPIWLSGGGVYLANNAAFTKNQPLIFTNNFTIIIDVLIAPASGTYKSMFCQRNVANTNNEIHVGLDGTNRIFLSALAVLEVGAIIPVGRQLLAWTGGTFYSNGENVGSYTATYGPARPSLIYLGQRNNFFPLNGPMFGIRIYNRMLLASEITQHYKLSRGLTA